MQFSNQEEFELHVHKCFGKIFELLMDVDTTVKRGAEEEESAGKFGVMCDLRDTLEEVILHCHLAWQYHRLSRSLAGSSSWDVIENKSEEG